VMRKPQIGVEWGTKVRNVAQMHHRGEQDLRCIDIVE
jgi:hypothetical protein